jgi:hypothetical protein
LGALNDVGFGALGPIPSVSHDVPYEQAWSFGVQKGLPGKIVAEVNYVGKKGTHLYLGGFRENNLLPASAIKGLAPDQIGDLANTLVANPFFGYITDPLSPLSGDQVPEYQLLLPYPQFTSFAGDSPPIASSTYHAAQFRVEKAFANGFQFWSHTPCPSRLMMRPQPTTAFPGLVVGSMATPSACKIPII